MHSPIAAMHESHSFKQSGSKTVLTDKLHIKMRNYSLMCRFSITVFPIKTKGNFSNKIKFDILHTYDKIHTDHKKAAIL